MERKKTGPKYPYAVKKILDKMNIKEKSILRRKIYIEKIPKYKLCKEINLSYPLMNDLIKQLGSLTADDLF